MEHNNMYAVRPNICIAAAMITAFLLIAGSMLWLSVSRGNSLIASETADTISISPTETLQDESQLSCEKIGLFSGQYVEDGKDEQVENIVTLLVKNNSECFLDLATITYNIDGKAAAFVVTGLPAGRAAWVQEAGRMTATADSSFTYIESVEAYRDGVSAKSDKVEITAENGVLTALNKSNETLEGVFIYYRNLHTDGNFLGGITYLADFGTIAPGETSEATGAHFNNETTEIVRVGWSE